MKLRDRLIFTFTPMVRYIVYRKIREVPAQCDVDDFLSCGMEALIRSIERYDPARGATLEQYAWTRIHGAVLDELRRHDWAPRSLRRAERTIKTRTQELHWPSTSAEPTRGELAAAARHDRQPSSARASMSWRCPSRLPEQDDSRRGQLRLIERIDTLREPRRARVIPRSARNAAPRRNAFAKPSRDCPTRERQVAVLLYVEGAALRDIGNRLGVSESRVSQIHAELRGRLRECLKDDEALLMMVG